jgi:hypothetical protein
MADPSFLNSLIAGISSSTAVVGFVTGAAGTVFGAWLTSRGAHKRRIVEELKAVRAAYALSQTITNGVLALKSQHIKLIKDRYDRDQIEFIIARWNHTPHSLMFNMNRLSVINFPSDRLQNIVFEKCLVNMKCMSLAVQMHTSAEDLRASIELRNELVEKFQKNSSASTAEKIQFYFGYPGNGIVDHRFRNNVDALIHQVDDCITFSMMLCEELLKRYNAVHGRYKYRFRLGLYKMIPGDWSEPRAKGLVPPRELWADWDEKFIFPPTWWQRFMRAFNSGRLEDWREIF